MTKYHKYTFNCPVCNSVIEHIHRYTNHDRYEQAEGWKIFNDMVTDHLTEHDGIIVTEFNKEVTE